MIRDLVINDYRGIAGLHLEELKNVNVFVGPNNCGKTSILEAIIFSGLFDDVELLVNTLVSRYHGFSTQYFESLFPVGHEPVICIKSGLGDDDRQLHTHVMFEKSRKISKGDGVESSDVFELQFLYGYDGVNEDRHDRFYVRFEEDDDSYHVEMGKAKENVLNLQVPCKFISFSRFDRTERLMNDVDKILDQNLRNELIDILRIFDGDIVKFEIVGKGRTIKLFRKNQEMPLTLYDYGNGMYKAFFIATSALLAKDGILLVDEIEAGIHSRALLDFIAKLLKVCAVHHVQLFLTTHSLEAVDIILDDCCEELEQMAVYHIKNGDGQTTARRYGGKKLLDLRNEIGFDVR